MKAIRWSGSDDRYFGPFTYAPQGRYRRFGIMLGSGDDDDYPGCRVALHGFGHTLIIALPAVIKPWSEKIPYSSPDIVARATAEGRDPWYWDKHEREYGFTWAERTLHLHYGPQTHASWSTKSKCVSIPWLEKRHVRHSIFDANVEHFADMPQFKRGGNGNYRIAAKALEAACSVRTYAFLDFDGAAMTAKVRVEEREWHHGTGWFRWLSWFKRPMIVRALAIEFSGETGRRKGSWKGGTIASYGAKVLPGDTHEAAFMRYCDENEMEFVGELPG